jgi:hypothetical protein
MRARPRPAHPAVPKPDQEVELGSGDINLPEADEGDQEQLEPETGEVQLGTGEIELVEGSVSTTGAQPGRRGKLVRRDRSDDPDDPDIL